MNAASNVKQDWPAAMWTGLKGEMETVPRTQSGRKRAPATSYDLKDVPFEIETDEGLYKGVATTFKVTPLTVEEIEKQEMFNDPRSNEVNKRKQNPTNFISVSRDSDFSIVVSNVVVTKRVTAVELAILGDDRQPAHRFTGEAYRCGNDPQDDEVGLKLAIGRALESAAKTMLRQAEGKVKHNDDVREMRPIQRQQRVKRMEEARALREERRAARDAENNSTAKKPALKASPARSTKVKVIETEALTPGQIRSRKAHETMRRNGIKPGRKPAAAKKAAVARKKR